MLKWFEKMTIQQAQRQQPSPELNAVEQAVSRCFAGITGSEQVVTQFNLDTHSLDILYTDASGKKVRVPMKNLSDGYKNTIGMIADIAYRMAILNPQLLENVLTETPGIVLIDEVDLHLHPVWQQRIIRDLQTLFPKVQFIVSTHAPSVISSVKRENMLVLDADGQPYTLPVEVYGKDANSILSAVMDANHRPAEVQAMFDRFYLTVETDLTQAESILNEIEALIGSEDPELTQARVTLALEQL
jgi:predicted ATP-binding protein involved in virulence